MRRDDYFLLIASGLLKLTAQDSTKALDHFSKHFEIEEPGKAGFVSLGGADDAGRALGLKAWIKSLQTQNIRSVACSWTSPEQPSSLAPHIAAAFAGTQQLVLAVTTEKGINTFLMSTRFSSQHEMTVESFINVIDAQAESEYLWGCVADMVLKHNRLNNRSEFEPSAIKTHLLQEGRGEFDFLSNQLIQEVQIECAVRDKVFVIPEDLKHLFYKSDFLPFDSDRTSVFLYAEGDVSVKQLKELVDAQPFGNEVWEKVISNAAQYYPPELPTYSAGEWPSKLDSLNEMQFSMFSNLVCRAICDLCEERSLPRTIPDHLKGVFGPDEYEHKKAQARGNSSNQWFLSRNEHPWELYLFERIQNLRLEQAISLDKSRTEFIEALRSIAAFAKKINSPFEEAFELSIFLLTTEERSGVFDSGHIETLRKKLEEQKFSEQALEHFDRVSGYAEDMVVLKFQGTKISDLLAVSVSDVFGGMGSWNDQYVENDQEGFDRVSALMFSKLKVFFSGALS